MPWPIISDDPWVQEHYELCRERGTSHMLAEMFAHARPPMSDTDREFLEGRCNENQFVDGTMSGIAGNKYRRIAQRHGVSVKGKVYVSGLARYPGDPKAWISGKGEAKKLLEERGWGCLNGTIKGVKSRNDNEPETVGVAPDILAREVKKELAKSGRGRNRDVEAVADMVYDRIKPRWAGPRKKAAKKKK